MEHKKRPLFDNVCVDDEVCNIASWAQCRPTGAPGAGASLKFLKVHIIMWTYLHARAHAYDTLVLLHALSGQTVLLATLQELIRDRSIHSLANKLLSLR